jgi:putative ABC transport system permease protein
MHLVALKMLWGDRAKYLGLVFGIMFATLLMSQQVSIFVGIMSRTGSQIRDLPQANLWVMHPEIQYIEEIKPMPVKSLLKVRAVQGVEWAVPLYKGFAVARAPGGVMQQIIIMGVDDSSLVGIPPKLVMGTWEDLRQPQAIALDAAAFQFFWPGEKLQLGKTLEINDQRAYVAVICDAAPPFITFPLVFARYSEALRYAPGERNRMSFVVVKTAAGEDEQIVKARIDEQTGLQALTSSEFHWRSIHYYLKRTGIAINFGTTVILGFIIGAAIAGQTFYIFVIENLRQFAALKAVGVENRQILGMVLLQAAIVAFIGYSLGLGVCAMFFDATEDTVALKGFTLHWQVAAMTAAAITVIILVASIASIRKVLKLDPALVFR